MSVKEATEHYDQHKDGTEMRSRLSGMKPAIFPDSVHDDEAVRVIAQYSGDQEWGETEEKRLVRKIDRKPMPLMFLTYGLQYYDKAMLSQAVSQPGASAKTAPVANRTKAIFGLRTDLHLETSNRFSFSSSIFYMGFIAGAMPAILMAQRFPIERVTATVICIWGICLLCTIACHNYQGLYSQRFFLGFLESGISPMFMLIVTGFYKKNEQAMRIGVWFSASR